MMPRALLLVLDLRLSLRPSSWGAHSTLEDVFLALTKDSHQTLPEQPPLS